MEHERTKDRKHDKEENHPDCVLSKTAQYQRGPYTSVRCHFGKSGFGVRRWKRVKVRTMPAAKRMMPHSGLK
jgi:hypothetical protein